MTEIDLINLRTLISQTEQQIKSARTIFRSTITDKSLNLDERWNLFSGAPDYLKETYSSSVPPFLQDKRLIEMMQPDDKGTQRDVGEMVWDIQTYLGDAGYEWLTKETVDQVKEEILRHNISRWIYHW